MGLVSNLPTPSPTKADFIAWVANFPPEKVIGLGLGPQIGGPLSNFFRDLGFTDILVTREDILGTYRGVFTDIHPIPGWMQIVMSAEEEYRGDITAGSFLQTLDTYGF